MKRKLLLILFISFAFFLFFVNPSFAADTFSIAADADYTVSDANITHTALHIFLTNTTSQYYASEYTIRVGFENIDNLRASDPDGAIIPIVSKDSNGYAIKVPFNKRVVGISNTLPFTIEFDTPDIVEQQGSVYEINIPGIANQNDFSRFDVHVRVPGYYGSPTFIKPAMQNSSLDFTKEQLGDGGVSIAFGNNAMYAFSLTYRLRNKNLFPIRTEIAIPPNTTYQAVSIEDISPKPNNVTIDTDGNWLAQYSLFPSEEKTVLVKGKVVLSLTPKEDPQTTEQLAPYLVQKRYWDTTDSKIAQLAKQLKTPRAIYEYVEKTLSYDFSRVSDQKERLGAAVVLRNPTSAVCLEFTDLFIALARAAGIPAREIDGYGYAQNKKERPVSLNSDILHAWPQYYDESKKTWVMVDPTWGNTTNGVDYFDVFDFNHIAFVIKGSDSTYPIPAGGYKLQSEKSLKDIVIAPIMYKPLAASSAKATLHMDEKVFAGISFGGFTHIANPGGTLFPSSDIKIQTANIVPVANIIQTKPIAPFGYITVPFSFQKTDPFSKKDATITVHIGEASVSQTVSIVPAYYALFEQPLLPWTIGGGVIIACIAAIIWLITRKPGNLPVSK